MAASARDGRGRSPSYTGPSYSSNTGNASSANSSANNAASYASLVVFRVQVGEDFGHGEDVYVCGNTPSLGMFDPHRGVQLFASTASYPFFQSNVVPLKRGEVCSLLPFFVHLPETNGGKERRGFENRRMQRAPLLA